MSKRKPTLHAIGDIHGMLGEMLINLEEKKIVNSNGDWKASNGTLVFIGDLMDRGLQGYEVLNKVYELKTQAEGKGGEVVVTMGNHDVGFLNCAVFIVRRPKLREAIAAIIPKNELHNRKKFFDLYSGDSVAYRSARYTKNSAVMDAILTYSQSENLPSPEGIDQDKIPDESRELRFFQTQIGEMLYNGMNLEDLILTTESENLITWAVAWPSMFVKGNVLFQHCDSVRAYKSLENMAGDFEGTPLEKVNHVTANIMSNPSCLPAYNLWNTFTAGRYWDHNHNQNNISDHIEHFAPGAKMVAHGHTRLSGEYLPSFYAENKAVNLDVGLAYYPDYFGKVGRMVDLTERTKAKSRAKRSA
jgi:hypothetical protein